MLKPDIPQDQIAAIRPILDPLLDRLHNHMKKLPQQAGSALVYSLAPESGDREGGQ